MAENVAQARKFPGAWDWVGIAGQDDRVVIAHAKSSKAGGRPALVSLNHYSLPRPYERMAQGELLSVLAGLIGRKAAQRAQWCICLAEDQYRVLPVKDADAELSDQDRHDAIRFLMQDLPFPSQTASYDTLSVVRATRSRSVAAADVSVIEPLVRESAYMRLPLAAVDVQEAAQRNVSHMFEAPGVPLAMLTLIGPKAVFTITMDGVILVNRRIDVLVEGRSLADEVRERKITRDHLIEEVANSFDKFDRQSGLPPLQRLLLAPGPYAAAVAADLSHATGVQVTIASAEAVAGVLDVSEQAASSSAKWSGLYLMAIGASLRGADGAGGPHQTNLYEASHRPPREHVTLRNALAAALLAGVGFGVAGTMSLQAANEKLHDVAARKAALERRRADVALKAPALAARHAKAASEVEALTAASEQLTTVLNAARQAQNSPGEKSAAKVLEGLARAATPGIWLTEADVAASGKVVTIGGRMLHADALPPYIASLAQQPLLASLQFEQLEVALPSQVDQKELPITQQRLDFWLRAKPARGGR